jgi:Pregnancy-associated plasma protein-A
MAISRTVATILSFILAAPSLAQAPLPMQAPIVCGTPEPDLRATRQRDALARSLFNPEAVKAYQIPIAFHVIAAGKKDRITLSQIQALVNNMNIAFAGTPFSFFLYRADLINKKAWHDDCGPGTKNEKAMKKRLAIDPAHVVNIYSCSPRLKGLPPGLIVLGIATFPDQYPENSTSHGIALHPSVLPGGSNPDYGTYGLVGIHEMGHYLGLFHTFQGGCSDGDLVADTPAQAAAHFACLIGVDTCAGAPGADDTQNFMNYSNDQCMNHFTPLQVERMLVQTGFFRPSL